jgi:DNA-binding CsgD family transcriptional regulator
MLQAEGKTFLDLPAVFKSAVAASALRVWSPPSYAEFCARQDDEEEGRNPGHKQRQAGAAAEKRRREAEYRAAVIAKYGSESAALELDERERALDVALMPLIRRVMRQDATRSYELTTLDGWHAYDKEDPPEQVAAAIKAAWPFPETVPAAKAEADYWSERSRERRAIWDDMADSPFSLPCDARRRLVDDALQTGLRAQSLADVVIRQRVIVEAVSLPGHNELTAVLADLERLSEQENATAPFHNGHPASATARRAEVVRLLSSLDTSGLSDREIARQVGVSPMTVGNIRRRMAAEALAKAGPD